MDHRRYNGGALLGLRGLVFKSHGSADELAFGYALGRAYDAARNNLLDRVQVRIAHAAPLVGGCCRASHAGVGSARLSHENLLTHHWHRQLFAATPFDQCRFGGRTGRSRRGVQR